MARMRKRVAAEVVEEVQEDVAPIKAVVILRKVFLHNTIAQAGETITVPSDVADRMIAKGSAREVRI